MNNLTAVGKLKFVLMMFAKTWSSHLNVVILIIIIIIILNKNNRSLNNQALHNSDLVFMLIWLPIDLVSEKVEGLLAQISEPNSNNLDNLLYT